ncbi:hypothetical protein SAMN02745126_03978 [Enhydrobacter aerosaccus]|uniref:Uncharacterized protein n=1 Tax=Enhydrobacter aerosaccus TaxID=225324 RepID=A0A1T4RNA4_9HYPH|nr:hypothetical protein [Enhydrobacter aerosaccus]SKA17480.1 hypothetical protein SAMN02745126_03978 [Enhydrobacter aerosaccus]
MPDNMIDLKDLDLHPVFSLLDPTHDAIANDIRAASRAALHGPGLESDSSVGPDIFGSLTAKLMVMNDNAALGFKFVACADGSMVVELHLGAASTKELSALLDVGAACLSKMDDHATREGWGA